jgi:hypothetical protein
MWYTSGIWQDFEADNDRPARSSPFDDHSRNPANDSGTRVDRAGDHAEHQQEMHSEISFWMQR